MNAAVNDLRPVDGFEGLYSVTADGRVWAHPRTWVDFNGRPRSHDGHWMKQSRHSAGYWVVNLYRERQSHYTLVHRIVALAWVPNSDPTRRVEVNHLSGDKSDARAANLEWCTSQENHQHAHRTGLRKMTARQLAHASCLGRSMRKLTFAEAEAIRGRCASGALQKTMAATYGVSRAAVGLIIRRKTYATP